MKPNIQISDRTRCQISKFFPIFFFFFFTKKFQKIHFFQSPGNGTSNQSTDSQHEKKKKMGVAVTRTGGVSAADNFPRRHEGKVAAEIRALNHHGRPLLISILSTTTTTTTTTTTQKLKNFILRLQFHSNDAIQWRKLSTFRQISCKQCENSFKTWIMQIRADIDLQIGPRRQLQICKLAANFRSVFLLKQVPPVGLVERRSSHRLGCHGGSSWQREKCAAPRHFHPPRAKKFQIDSNIFQSKSSG